MIQSYFSHETLPYEIKFIREQEFWGTAGSLKMLENQFTGPFVVSNCDVIVEALYADVLALHVREAASLTILSSFKHFQIPYGVIEFKKGGEITNIVEKPEQTQAINTGIYILNPEVLELIPESAYFDMTDLIQVLIKKGEKVVTYPVNENDYADIGQWKEYQKTINKFEDRHEK